MTKRFEFETSDGVDLLVSIDVQCRDYKGVDETWDLEYAEYKATGLECLINTLSDADQSRLEKRCSEVAYENACEAAQSYLEGAADRAYDEWKERDRDSD